MTSTPTASLTSDRPSGSTEGRAKRLHKQKCCRTCLTKFTPNRPLQVVCSVGCAIEADRKARRKAERKVTRQKLVALRTVSDWTKLAQAEFNRWIKIRDALLPCVSCGTSAQKTAYHKIDGWVASHYRSTGACPELRFEPSNVHRACVRCNSWLSGNISEYRIGLVARIGPEKLAWLEGPHEPKRYRIEDLIAIRDDYRAKVKALKAHD